MKAICTLCSFLLIVSLAWAQESVSTSQGYRVMVLNGAAPAPDSGPMVFQYKEVMRGGEFVKGAPYIATATTETTQVLADGNRIVNKSSGLLARDSEGRTRREEIMSNAGPLPLDRAKMVFINDPSTGSEYVLNAFEKTADVMKHGNAKVMTLEQKRTLVSKSPETAALPKLKDEGETKWQPLGTEVIEGLSCDHILSTQTVPAGVIGNEQPIVITSETWASPELHLLIMRKHNDPRFGETVYKLTDIRREEPDPSLFQVPPDFKVLDKLPPLRSPME